MKTKKRMRRRMTMKARKIKTKANQIKILNIKRTRILSVVLQAKLKVISSF